MTPIEKELLAALQHGDRLYGLELLSRINAARHAQEMEQVGIDSLYPALKRLEEAGLIEGDGGSKLQSRILVGGDTTGLQERERSLLRSHNRKNKTISINGLLLIV